MATDNVVAIQLESDLKREINELLQDSAIECIGIDEDRFLVLKSRENLNWENANILSSDIWQILGNSEDPVLAKLLKDLAGISLI